MKTRRHALEYRQPRHTILLRMNIVLLYRERNNNHARLIHTIMETETWVLLFIGVRKIPYIYVIKIHWNLRCRFSVIIVADWKIQRARVTMDHRQFCPKTGVAKYLRDWNISFTFEVQDLQPRTAWTDRQTDRRHHSVIQPAIARTAL